MDINQEKLNEFLDKTVGDLAAGYGGVMVSIGDKLGLYKAMAGAGPLTSDEVSKKTGCTERYVREWLNSQAAAGYIDYHPASETFELSQEHALVLADSDSPTHMTPAWNVVASLWADEERTLKIFRNGEGFPWGEHDDRLFCGSAAFYRNAYKGQLLPEWLPALDGVIEKLKNGARVADIGCGHGHSTVLMAQAFPNSRFFGFDTHQESVNAAREIAAEEGVAERVDFSVEKADDYEDEKYDLICFFDCLHDMGDPIGVVDHARRSLAEDGSIMLVEPFASDQLEENINPVGRLYYSASTTLCCAHAMSEDGGYALGAQAGEARLANVFEKAGFGSFRNVLKTPFNMIFQAQL